MGEWLFWFDQTVIGLVLGTLYALLAAGIALVFGVARLINFAHGSVFMAGAYVGWVLLAWGGLPLWLALPAAFVAGALLGLVLERLALRPFLLQEGHGPLLATLGLGMVLDSLAELVFTPDPRAFPPVLPDWRLQLGGVTLGFMDLLVLAVALGAGLLLFAFLRLTSLGRGLRAGAQDLEAARQMGVGVERVQRTAFALASGLGALTGLLFGLYYNQISPSMGFQAVLKGFCACVLGGLGSVPAAMAGGLVLGLGESLGVGLLGSAARSLIVYGLLVLALFVRPNGLFGPRQALDPAALTGSFAPRRGSLALPAWLGPACLVLAAGLPLVLADPYVLQILVNAWIAGVFCLGLTFLVGTAGIMSLGHAGLMAIGGYASALLTLKAGWPFWLAFPAAGLVAAGLGALMALPALRLKGHYIAMATLGLGEMVNQVILNADGLTQGAMGLPGIPPPQVFGQEVVTVQAWYWLSLGVLVLSLLAIRAFMAAPLGRTLRGIREDDTAALALGIPVWRYRLLAFGLSAFFAGLAGALTAHLYSYISYETFGSSLSLQGLSMAILGGLGNVWGALAGTLVLTILPEALRFGAGFRWLVYGLVLLAMLRFRPQGLLGSGEAGEAGAGGEGDLGGIEAPARLSGLVRQVAGRVLRQRGKRL